MNLIPQYRLVKHSEKKRCAQPVYVKMLLCALLISTSACTTFLPSGDTVRLFILTPQQLAPPAEAPLWSSLSIRVESASRLDSDRLLMLDDAQELLPYSGARWAGRVPELIAESWATSLERSKISEISYDQPRHQGVRPSLVLHLRDFQAQLLEAARASCRVSVVLEFLPANGQAVQRLSISAEQQVETSDPAQVAAGFDAAHAMVLARAIKWLKTLPRSD